MDHRSNANVNASVNVNANTNVNAASSETVVMEDDQKSIASVASSIFGGGQREVDIYLRTMRDDLNGRLQMWMEARKQYVGVTMAHLEAQGDAAIEAAEEVDDACARIGIDTRTWCSQE